MNPLCYIGLHHYKFAIVKSKLPKPNYESHGGFRQFSTIELENRDGRTCQWCKKEQVWSFPSRWTDGKYINAIK